MAEVMALPSVPQPRMRAQARSGPMDRETKVPKNIPLARLPRRWPGSAWRKRPVNGRHHSPWAINAVLDEAA